MFGPDELIEATSGGGSAKKNICEVGKYATG